MANIPGGPDPENPDRPLVDQDFCYSLIGKKLLGYFWEGLLCSPGLKKTVADRYIFCGCLCVCVQDMMCACLLTASLALENPFLWYSSASFGTFFEFANPFLFFAQTGTGPKCSEKWKGIIPRIARGDLFSFLTLLKPFFIPFLLVKIASNVPMRLRKSRMSRLKSQRQCLKSTSTRFVTQCKKPA